MLERSGFREETYHTFSYSPLADDAGTIVGMLCVVTEETQRIIGERRLVSLRDLAAGIAGKYTREELIAAVERSLGGNLKDLPFTLMYLFGADGMAHLAGTTGVPSGHAMAAAVIDPADPDAVWPAGEVQRRRATMISGDLGRRFARHPGGSLGQATERGSDHAHSGSGSGRAGRFHGRGSKPLAPA